MKKRNKTTVVLLGIVMFMICSMAAFAAVDIEKQAADASQKLENVFSTVAAAAGNIIGFVAACLAMWGLANGANDVLSTLVKSAGAILGGQMLAGFFS